MDLSQIKHLITRNGDRVILVENGEPEVVLMSFAEYEKMTGVSAAEPRSDAAPRQASFMNPVAEEAGFVRETKVWNDPFETPPSPPDDRVSDPAGSQAFSRRIEEVRLEDLPL